MVITRPAAPADLDFLWSMLFYASHAEEQHGTTVQSIRLDPDLVPYLAGWKEGKGFGLVATRGDRRVGAAWLRAFDYDEAHLATYVDDQTPELAIAVEPEWIGYGVGSLLLDALLKAADRAGVPGVVLSVRSENPAARLYRRYGFVEIGRIRNRVGTHSLKMIRDRPADGCGELTAKPSVGDAPDRPPNA